MRSFWSRWCLAALTLGLSAVAGAAPDGEAVHLRLTVVFDNVGGRSGLTPGWGFSCLVESAGTTLAGDADRRHQGAARRRQQRAAHHASGLAPDDAVDLIVREMLK